MWLVGWLLVDCRNRAKECDSYLYSPKRILNGPSEIRPNFRSYFSSVPMSIARK